MAGKSRAVYHTAMLQFPYAPSKSAVRRKPERKAVNANQLPNDIKKHLQTAQEKLAVDDCAGASEQLWLAGRAAAVTAVRRRNWPADTDAEIHAAMRRIDPEYGNQMLILAGYGGAEMFKENAIYGFLDKDDIIAFQVGLRHFIADMLTLDAPDEA